MRAKHSEAGVASNTNLVTQRFWTLLIVILALAVTSSALAVRFTATPFLEAKQEEAILAQAHKSARDIETNIEQHRLFQSFIAGTPDIVSVVLGYVANSDAVLSYLDELQVPEELSYISLYDAYGASILDYDFRAEDRDFLTSDEINQLLRARLDEREDASRQIGFRAEGDTVYFALAEPIVNRGFTEGVLIAGYKIDISEIVPYSNIVESVGLVRTEGSHPGTATETLVSLNNFNLSVALIPNVKAAAEAGRRLISRSTIAVALVLMAAFALFAALGRAALVEPHKKLEKQKQSLQELAAIAEGAAEAIVVTDANGRITWVNPAFSELSGYEADEVRGRKPGSLLQGEGTDPATVESIRNAITDRVSIKTDILNYGRDGKAYWISISINPLQDENGKTVGFVAMSSDITESRNQQEAMIAAKLEIEHQALHDPLTSLPNRRALDVALSERAQQTDSHATIVRIDLDHFKYVNDTMGHAAGDFLLCEVAGILREETKSTDLPVRTGGDEFVILLSAERASSDGQKLAERMLDRIRQPKTFGNKTIRVGASFGVASTRDGMLSLGELLVGADAALYEAKDQGRNAVRHYTPDLHKAVLDRRELAREIRLAIVNEEFEPYFQAQFDAVDHSIVGAETLVRWNSPKFGVLAPNVFLPVAQQLSALDEIDEIVLRKGVSQIAGLQAEGIYIPKLSFNVTADRIQSQSLFATLESFSHYGLKIAFEILESVLVEEQTDVFNHCLDRLRDAGISIEIDDFGSGHASIVGLMHLRPDVMKIDQRLVMPITESATTRGLLEQIVGMADLMGLKVTAEGVESMEHANILAQLGCHTLQGYAFCKAMPIEQLREFVLSHQAKIPRARTGS